MNLENDQIREDQAARLQGEVDEEYFSTRLVDVECESARWEKEALVIYGMLEGSDPRIAPLRRCLGSYAGRPWRSLDPQNQYTNDYSPKNVSWSYATDVFGVKNIGRMERKFLDVLDYKLSVPRPNSSTKP